MQHHAGKIRILIQQRVNGGRRNLAHAAVFRIVYHAHNPVVRLHHRAVAALAEILSDGIGIRKELPRETFAHNHRTRLAPVVRGLEAAALEDPHPHIVEVIQTHRNVLSVSTRLEASG